MSDTTNEFELDRLADRNGVKRFQITWGDEERWGSATIEGINAEERAKVFLAAPDLLAALRGVLRVADRKTDEFDAARAAIKKATGSES